MSMRILTVDDSRMMREMLLMALKGAGFDVVQAEDGEHVGHQVEQGQRRNPDPTVARAEHHQLERPWRWGCLPSRSAKSVSPAIARWPTD